MKKTILLTIFLAVAACGMAQIHLNDKILHRSYVYFPLIERSLERHQMPKWLECVPIVESALKPTAKSRSGRMGMWQIPSSLATKNGLVVTDEVNECFDPELSTEVACRRLLELYECYGDWLLAIVAFNTSQTTVDNAIAQADGSRDYWDVYKYLPLETRGFVPALLAVSYAIHRPEEYGLHPMCGIDIWSDSETLVIIDTLSFSRISSTIGISMEELCRLNPKYVKKRIPVSNERCYTLRLPKRYADQYKQIMSL